MKIRRKEKSDFLDHAVTTHTVTASFGWIRPFLGKKTTGNRWVKREWFKCGHSYDCCGCCHAETTTVIKTGRRAWLITTCRSFNY
jgi:hypothetical protein